MRENERAFRRFRTFFVCRFLPGEPINQFYGPQAPLQATEYKGDCAQLEIGSGTYKVENVVFTEFESRYIQLNFTS